MVCVAILADCWPGEVSMSDVLLGACGSGSKFEG